MVQFSLGFDFSASSLVFKAVPRELMDFGPMKVVFSCGCIILPSETAVSRGKGLLASVDALDALVSKVPGIAPEMSDALLIFEDGVG